LWQASADAVRAATAGRSVQRKVVRFLMPDYNALKEILGKTIKGAIVKKNVKGGHPTMSVHLVFSDDTSYEIYTDYHMNFAGGLDRGDMDYVRNYAIAPMGPMKNVLDITVDEL
jgi:hypothetical protein